MSTLPTQYEPKTTEAKWQQLWAENQVFQANPAKGGEPYSIVIPPPNVTGSLHMGHAFNTALIDTLIRYHRMRGKNTLCLPGTDHASIAVQTLIEKQLKAEGKTRYDLGREEFLQRAWQWRRESGGKIVDQLQRLGLSADWSRERFTLDENVSHSVRQAFVQLYEDGLIYRGNYLVNWCPESQSAVSDLEVENKEVDGKLWHFRYPLTDGSGYVEVATTRPETMLGDTAVAVNPNDERYQHLIGKTITLPIMGREIPIIADDLVEPAFGTGCVKVTPAHDPNDFQMGQRHQLPFINIMNQDGSLNENAGPFAGEDRFLARQNVVNRLEADGVLVKVEDYRHTVPYSDRGKVPVEPLLSTQWFVKIESLSQNALSSLDDANSPQFIPERWRKVYRDWLVKLKDWCISRQLWWGHQIPAWYVVSETDGEITDRTPFIVALNEEEANSKARATYGENFTLKQDPDVLDTWFSSGLWPFSTLGWPEKTADWQMYYPNSTMVTGFDIIFFWVARMTMMGGYLTGKMPFKDVYIHGLVRDENGKKMSKSANNGIDPLLLIEKYGTDALRYTLIKEVAGAGQDITLQYDRKTHESESVEAARNFANKIWNAARFVMMNLDGKTPQDLGKPPLTPPYQGGETGGVMSLELSDRWILSRFHQVVEKTTTEIEAYNLGEAAKGLYEFIWGDFCDWYIELVKPRLWQDKTSSSRLVAQQTLAYVLEGILKLLHPFMPHITEEIWQNLTQKSGEFLPLQPYGEAEELLRKEKAIVPVAIANKKQIVQQAVKILENLPDAVTQFFSKYQGLIITIALVLGGIIGVKLLLAVVMAIHRLPLMSPSLRLLGLWYTISFLLRNVLWAENRQKLPDLTWLKKEIIGTKKPKKLPSQQVDFAQQVEINSLISPKLEEQFKLLFATIRTLRNLRAEAEIKPGVKVPVILQTESNFEQEILEEGAVYIQDLAKVEKLTITSSLTEDYGQAIAGVVGTIQALIPLSGIADIAALGGKLEKNLGKVEAEINSLSGRLNNAGFVNKAPAEVIQSARDSLAAAEKQAQILRDRLQLLR
ncbi:MAG: valine--tRNA ligase [Gomphosphaeria aponina SAG 52.96 = DSM 107014]|uniref:Valine--tRNA ligase n=1 Tax=Gomphosphaeria aponina SAG 52.96 = DSM 107014 TaxID=1521640 RepID=A0A941JPT9_9CHRO|nr:valine--tRNA ligase [Gomphosphaeria aponina SAG 52.96 = DSM 107014]